ncbi:MAG: hypothetical protein J7K51_01725 [Thermotogae bacterium]|nr:hypothetical protein [Thermotogota bacterium]
MNIEERQNHKIYIQMLRQMSPERSYIRRLSCLNLPGNFLFMVYTKDSRILRIKNSKKYFWSVWINVTTGIIKKGYSNARSGWNPIYDNRFFVSSLQGEPQSTPDIDMVIAIQKPQAVKLVKDFPSPDFYSDENSILDAIKKQSMFNLIDLNTEDNVDFWILTNTPFDLSRFSRKISEEFMGLKMQVASPEDTILVKLRWAKLSGGSEKQSTVPYESMKCITKH